MQRSVIDFDPMAMNPFELSQCAFWRQGWSRHVQPLTHDAIEGPHPPPDDDPSGHPYCAAAVGSGREDPSCNGINVPKRRCWVKPLEQEGPTAETLREQWARVQSLDNEIAVIEGRLKRALAKIRPAKWSRISQVLDWSLRQLQLLRRGIQPHRRIPSGPADWSGSVCTHRPDIKQQPLPISHHAEITWSPGGILISVSLNDWFSRRLNTQGRDVDTRYVVRIVA